MATDLAKIRQLLEAFEASKDPSERNALLDELQDAVGLGGKMVLDKDITRRAKQLIEKA